MTEEKAATKKKAAGGTKKVSDKLAAVGAIGQAIGTEVQKVIIGKSHVIDNVMINILSNGNPPVRRLSRPCKDPNDEYVRRCSRLRLQACTIHA